MTPLRNQHGRAPWIAIAATAVLAFGLGAAWWNWQSTRGPQLKRPTPVDIVPDSSVIQQALSLAAPVDSSALKMRWVDEVPGFDVSALSASRREIFVRFANAERCTCGCGYTLAACRVYDSTCEASGHRVETLLDSVRVGHIMSAAGIRKRPA
jgi:hypothetical protein